MKKWSDVISMRTTDNKVSEMKFEEANDIISRRYGYHMATIPTDEEVEEAEKAFGVRWGRICPICTKRDICNMKGTLLVCNFFTEEKK